MNLLKRYKLLIYNDIYSICYSGDYGVYVQIDSNGHQTWKLHGKSHRLNGPAKIHGKYVAWFVNGLLHRIDGPALVWHDGDARWYARGVLHNENGPAAICGGTPLYYVDGDEVYNTWE